MKIGIVCGYGIVSDERLHSYLHAVATYAMEQHIDLMILSGGYTVKGAQQTEASVMWEVIRQEDPGFQMILEEESISTLHNLMYSLLVRTFQILMDEIGLRDTVDPLAGSYFMETLTKEMEEKILEEMEKIEKMGGMVEAVSSGYVQREVAKQAYDFEKKIPSTAVGMQPQMINIPRRNVSSFSYSGRTPPAPFIFPGVLNNVTNKSPISLKKTTMTARSVPTCKQISNNSSGSFRPNIFCINTKCPELLTGKNSVSPCIMPRDTA